MHFSLVHKPSHSPLLLRPLNSRHITHPILNIKLNIHTPTQRSLPIIQRARLDNRLIGHDVEFGVEAGSAVGAEEVAVVFAGGAGYVAVFGGSLNEVFVRIRV